MGMSSEVDRESVRVTLEVWQQTRHYYFIIIININVRA